MKPIWSRLLLLASVASCLLTYSFGWRFASSEPPVSRQAEVLARELLRPLEGAAGLCVHLGPRDGTLTTALAAGGSNLVHALAEDAETVAAVQRQIDLAQLAGVVSVQQADASRLPYADKLVNLLVADNLPDLLQRGVSIDEVRRVLRPGGVAWLGQSATDATGVDHAALDQLLQDAGVDDFQIIDRQGLWARFEKSAEASNDQWTHPRHSPSGNPVSHDAEVEVPTGPRWMAGPLWPTGYRKSAVPAVVATDNQLVYLFQDEVETPKGARPQDTLVARDSHNGLLLWQRAGVKKSAALAAVDDRIYTVVEEGGPLVALDAASGETITTFVGTAAPRQVSVVDGHVLTESSEGFSCYDARSGRLRWSFLMTPEQFLAMDQRVYLHTRQRDSEGNRESRFVCLDLADGRERWQQSTRGWASGTPTLVLAFEDVLVAADKQGNHGIAAADGRHLWAYSYDKIGHGGSYLKVLAMNGLVWVHNASSQEKGQYAWEGLDPRSGELLRRLIKPKDFSLKHRCNYDVATTRLIMCGSMDFASYETGEYYHFDAARNSCARAGVIPANGLLYTFPHGCGCYPMLRGFMALEGGPQEPQSWLPGPWRLVRGPAYTEQLPKWTATEEDWPTYRCDSLRTASSSEPGPQRLAMLWEAPLGDLPEPHWAADWNLRAGGRVSSPVVAGSLAIAAATDQHRLVAVDAATGQPRWTFSAGGRIDCPPTLHEGLCLFGSRDGWVYCLRAEDGALRWRFCAAPQDQRIVAYGQLESRWPVVGGVLVYQGKAYFGVGRHAGADGGITVCALDPLSGELLWNEHAADYKGIPDVLAAADGAIQMASYRFDAETGQSHDAKESLLRGGRLGLLNDAWYQRPIAMRRNLQTWQASGRQSAQIIAFHPEATSGFLACESVAGGDGKMSGDAELFVKATQGDQDWSLRMTNKSRLRGMAITRERVYVAGLLPVGGSGDLQYLAQVYSLADGTLLSEAELPGRPVHDGLALSGRRLYLALDEGRLVCLGEP